MHEVSIDSISQHLNAFFLAAVLSFLLLTFAWQKGFFKYTPRIPAPVEGFDVLKVFLAFIISQVLIVPAVIGFIFSLTSTSDFQHLSIQAQGWINILTIEAGFLAVVLVFLNLPVSLRSGIWGDCSNWYRHLSLGILTWFLSYPIVVALDQLFTVIIHYFFQSISPVDQVAVKHFKIILSDPLLFWLTTLFVTLFVPMVEELLFRGFLQSWLRRKIKSPFRAIVLTSFIFALFHYSSSQGITNIALLSSLFILSCFLGFLYERQHSLWASIGLHGFFNAMSIFMLAET